MKRHLLLIMLTLAVGLSSAQTKLATIFTDHMVLQRNTNVAVWGKDKPNQKLNIETSWGESITVKADKQGNWKTNIKTIEAGGPYELTVEGSSKIKLSDILLGEVWLCSGQSNMEMTLNGFEGQPVYGSNKAILNSNNNNLRFFKVKREISAQPLNTCGGNWSISTPETAKNFSAVAYFYGKMLNEQLDIPVGLISSSWGGTPAQAWTPNKTISQGFEELLPQLEDTSKYFQKTPTVLFNGMINPLIPFTIKGAIWYQGEANRKNADQYARLFPAMIKSWRERWELGDFPFYFVQLAAFDWGGEKWVELQESQLKSMKTVPNSGMVVTADIGHPTSIHPPHKKQVGERLAYWALANNYGVKGIQYSGPVYKSMEIKDGKAYLYFDYAPLGVCDMEKELTNFEIAGENKVYVEAKAQIKKGQLIVWNDKVPNPTAVRYGWKSYFKASLFNTAGLPASPFRTEVWED